MTSLPLMLSMVMVPNRSIALWPRSSGAFWLFTTEASTFLRTASPTFTSRRVMTVPSLRSPLAT